MSLKTQNLSESSVFGDVFYQLNSVYRMILLESVLKFPFYALTSLAFLKQHTHFLA